MALRCLAVLLSFLMAGGVMASAQQKNISLKVSNVSIESALNTIKSQYGISIVTQIEGLDLSSKVSVDIKNASVTEALKEIFKPQQIDVKIDGNDFSGCRQEFHRERYCYRFCRRTGSGCHDSRNGHKRRCDYGY